MKNFRFRQTAPCIQKCPPLPFSTDILYILTEKKKIACYRNTGCVVPECIHTDLSKTAVKSSVDITHEHVTLAVHLVHPHSYKLTNKQRILLRDSVCGYMCKFATLNSYSNIICMPALWDITPYAALTLFFGVKPRYFATSDLVNTHQCAFGVYLTISTQTVKSEK